MGKKIQHERKMEVLPFIKNNVGLFSQREIARKLNLGKTTINRWTKEIGYNHKKHTVDENFFDSWSEHSAYILGYIYADGNVAWNPKKGYQTLTITSAAKDKDHLEKIRQLIKSTKPLLYSNGTNSYRLIANNKVLVQKLMVLGVYPRKTLTIKFPTVVPNEYLSHFIRGIIDGDGHVRYVKREKSPYFEISISSGSINFCNGMIESINKIIDVKTSARKVGRNTFIMQYSCSRGQKLAQFVYTNASIFIERKYEKYKIFLEEHKNGRK